jgi:molybdate transport system ATP-binding protein
MDDLLIKYTNANFVKNEIEVLSFLNLEIKTQKNTAILGSSGSGKSMFLDTISGKLFPKQGNVQKNTNLKIVAVPRDYGFHRIVGSAYQYYQQRFTAMDAEIGPTLREILQDQIIPIGTVNLASVSAKPEKYTAEKIQEVCKAFMLEQLLDRKITSLSNGETRRSLLAYSFLQAPDFLILDEPFAGLDQQHRQELKSILANLSNVQIILVCSLRDLPLNFENILLLEQGKVFYYGPKTHLPALPTKRNSFDLEHLPLSIVTDEFENAVLLKNGKVKYGEKTVLENINWEIRKGEKWALMGPNGSGKSSLLSIITGDNLQCYANELFLFDKKRGSGESIWDLKRMIGYVSPELHLYFNKKIRLWKVLASGFFDTIGLFKNLDKPQENILNRFLENFGFEEKKEREFGQLSFGEQRRVLLARALIKNPKLLILDEPCQGLDYEQMLQFKSLIEQTYFGADKTLIYVTHYIDEIPSIVSKTLYLEDGKILKVKG